MFGLWVSSNKKLFIILCIVVGFIVLMIYANVSTGGVTSLTPRVDENGNIIEEGEEDVEDEENLSVPTSTYDPSMGIDGLIYDTGVDTSLLRAQGNLSNRFGTAPEGFIWDYSGDLLSLGNPDLTSEEVVYSYIRSLALLDFGLAQRYSRNSRVVKTYEGYFSGSAAQASYKDQFTRNMYKLALMSLQVEGVDNSAVFAENKRVYTVRGNMLDLTDKDFWLKDKDALFDEFYKYGYTESDKTKVEQRLYEYILDYYEQEDAVKRDISFDITVERYPDLNSGWLVSIDSDIDSACKYKDGTLLVNYIKGLYNEYAIDRTNYERTNRGSISTETPAYAIEEEESWIKDNEEAESENTEEATSETSELEEPIMPEVGVGEGEGLETEE